MSAERVFAAGQQVIGVILHEAAAAAHALGHRLDYAGHCGDLPVTLAAVAVALLHEPLACKPGELLHAVEILKGIGERLCALSVEHTLYRYLLTSLIAYGFDIVGADGVFLLIKIDKPVYLAVADRRHLLDEVADRPGVDLPAELYLNLDLVALRDGDVTHIIAEAHHLERPALGVADGASHPQTELPQDGFILPIAHDYLAGQPHSRADEAMLPVAVSRLIEIHEVHVYLFVRNLTVILRRKMAIGLLQERKSVYPHLARAEGMAPGDDAEAVVVVIRLFYNACHLVGGLDRSLVDEAAGDEFA